MVVFRWNVVFAVTQKQIVLFDQEEVIIITTRISDIKHVLDEIRSFGAFEIGGAAERSEAAAAYPLIIDKTPA